MGISFYKTLDGDRLLASMARVFKERGEGVVVRGGQATSSKEDRQPHLSEGDAEALLAGAFATYRKEDRTLPARVVLHTTPRYSDGERTDFRAAVERLGIDGVDFLSLDDSFSRPNREGEYPPLRGTLPSLLNWNRTQFDGRDPITTRAAHQVGAILPTIGENDSVEPLHSYYM